MPGFVQRFTQNPLYVAIADNVKNLASLGMKYQDMVVKQSKAIGATESQFAVQGPMPIELLYSLSMADIGTKKYVAYFDKDYKNRREFLRKFALNGEIEFILDTLSDECIIYDDQNFFCEPNTHTLEVHLNEDKREGVVDKIHEIFKKLYVYFHFNDDISAWQYFKQFLIDGFLSFEIIYDEKGEKIIGFKELDPLSLRPDVEQSENGYKKIWIQYGENPRLKRKLYDSQIIYISYTKGAIKSRLSYCERLVRSFNLLRIMENTRLIWNLMNSTYRLKMIVPIGSKSPQKAKESLAELLSIYKEEIYLDWDSGELLVNGRPGMQFYKNYMFPSKNGEHPDIEPIAGDGPDLSSIESLKYFYDKLKTDSKLPFSRFEKDSGGGQVYISAEGLDREEVRFTRFVSRLRSIFQEILWKPLWLQLSLDYPEFKDDEIIKANLGIKYIKDNVFEQLREQEVMEKKMQFIMTLKDYTENDQTTTYFDANWLIERYLGMSRDDIKENKSYKKNVKKEDDADDKDAETAVDSFSSY